MMPTHDRALLSRLPWLADGWPGQLERAFVRFLLSLDDQADAGVLLAAALVSKQLTQGEVYLDLQRLCRQPELLLADDASQSSEITLDWLRLRSLSDWQQVLSESALVGLGEGAEPLVFEQIHTRLYLRRYWQCQQIVSQTIAKRLQQHESGLSAAVQQQIDALFPPQSTPDWQKVACVLALRSRFSIITGGPGTGKTTTLTKLLAVLIQRHQAGQAGPAEPLQILLAAPTGKAAARVSESITAALSRLKLPEMVVGQMPKQAMTLHRLLGSQGNGRRYYHHRHRPLLADVVIVDEASMIDLEMMAALLDALDEATLLILLGDKDQLASVEAGAVLGDLCQGAEQLAYDAATCDWIARYAGLSLLPRQSEVINPCQQQTVMLQVSHRFGNDSGIGQLAAAVNAADAVRARAILDDPRYSDLRPPASAPADLPERRLQQLVTADRGFDSSGQPHRCQGYGLFRAVIDARPRSNQADLIDQWAAEVLTAFDRFRVLSALRQGGWGVEGLNQAIERWLLADTRPAVWYSGRPVMVSRNDYGLGLMNGDIGIALKDHQNRLRVAFAGAQGAIRWVSPLRLADVETAYAMTVHKSQGSEFDHVLLVLPETGNRVLSRELIYTGITRAKTQFTLLETAAGVFAAALGRNCRGA